MRGPGVIPANGIRFRPGTIQDTTRLRPRRCSRQRAPATREAPKARLVITGERKGFGATSRSSASALRTRATSDLLNSPRAFSGDLSIDVSRDHLPIHRRPCYILAMQTRVLPLLLGAAATIAAGACGNDEDRAATRIQVIDSSYAQSWEPMEDTGTVYRIAVFSRLGADTVRNVVPPAPIAVGDSEVLGLVQLSEDSSTPQRQIFRLRLGQH